MTYSLNNRREREGAKRVSGWLRQLADRIDDGSVVVSRVEDPEPEVEGKPLRVIWEPRIEVVVCCQETTELVYALTSWRGYKGTGDSHG